MNVALLEPYYGGSHAAFVDVLKRESRHRCTLVTLPARKWKWRMRGAAIWFAREQTAWMTGGGGAVVDVILTNDMLSVSDLRALMPPRMRNVPIVCYFHENQLTYPLVDEATRDYQYAMTNITSCLAADAVWFNSAFHRDDFLAAAAGLLRLMPDHVPGGAIEEIRDKASVAYPPVSVTRIDPRPANVKKPVTILWCHRWEYDKNPEPFFEALIRLDREGRAFDLVLLGEQFRKAPPVFADAWPRLASHVVHAGFVEDRAEYEALLSRCDVVVSTAIQENFGMAVLEAVLAGCQPLLPRRLAYPEVMPPTVHDACLYDGDDALLDRLREIVSGDGLMSREARKELQTAIRARFSPADRVRALDDAFQALVESVGQRARRG